MISSVNFLQVNRAQWVWKEFLFVETQGSRVEVSWTEGEESSASLTVAVDSHACLHHTENSVSPCVKRAWGGQGGSWSECPDSTLSNSPLLPRRVSVLPLAVRRGWVVSSSQRSMNR